MEYFAEGSPQTVIDDRRAGELLDGMLSQLGPMRRVLLVPPDITRLAGGAGGLTVMLYERLKACAEVVILPALGTHVAMTAHELGVMFPGIPVDRFHVHDWRRDLVRLGKVPADFVRQVTDGRLDFPVACEVNRLLVEGGWDRIISIGQLVPHEVAGIAGHTKNVLIGAGGQDTINRTHFIGAVCGMERIMGRARSPVREVLNYMDTHFTRRLPICHVLTVRAVDTSGRLVTRGLYAGDDKACFLRGAELCRQVNVSLLDAPLRKVVVHLDPTEYRSTWLGNKAIYRTRMAIADDGELVVLAPGVEQFGEDAEIDRLIRRYGYRGTPHTLRMVNQNADLAANLSAAAHLIHGSSEGRFRITWCPGRLTREEVEGVGFGYGDLAPMMARYDPAKLMDGTNTLPDGEEVFFISRPGLSLWAAKERWAGNSELRTEN